MAIDESRAKRVLKTVAERLYEPLGLFPWSIEWKFGRPDSDTAIAEAFCKLPYFKAEIVVYLPAHDTERQFIETVRHELIHVMLAEHQVGWQIVQQSAGADSDLFKAYDLAWTMGEERTLVRVERLLENGGQSLDELERAVAEADARGEPVGEGAKHAGVGTDESRATGQAQA